MSPSKRIRRITVVLGVLLLPLGVMPAGAAPPGIGIAWDHCQGEAGAVQNRSFACDTNVGTDIAYGTFVLAAPFDQLAGADSELRLVVAGAVIPPWWQVRNAGCRQGSLSAPPVPDPAATLCEDWTHGLGNGNLINYCLSVDPCGGGVAANEARLQIATFVTQDLGQDLVADQLYFTFSLRMNHAKTVGEGACGGCETPACITFNKLTVTPIGGGAVDLTTASIPGGNVITWQGGVAGVPMCLAATPTRNSTWGAVKSLYR